jgi:uncharacterized protein YkwD
LCHFQSPLKGKFFVRVCRSCWLFAGFVLLACILALPLLGMSSPIIQAKPTKTPKGSTSAGSPYDIITLVNQLRAANGLTPYQVNSALMASAQSHSQYQASIGSTTHTGSGGSDVKSRALAAGYGGGANVSVIENIYGGMGATPQRAVSWWQGDGPHLNTMLSTRHTDVGAGIAVSGGVVYITLDVGSVQGGAAPPLSTANPGSNPGSLPVTATPALLAFNPMVIATPNLDGSIVHVVQSGQALWNIAAAYNVALPDLLQMNGFTENTYIYPGDRIIVRPAAPVSSATTEMRDVGATETILDPATVSASLSTETPLAEVLESGAIATSAIQSDQPPGDLTSGSHPDPLMLFIGALVFGGAALVLAGNLMKRTG